MGLIAFFVGKTPVYWYGCTAAMAVITAFISAWVVFRFNEEKTAVLWDVFLWILPIVFIFSRVGHAVQNYSAYWEMPWQIMDFSNGGFSQFGAALGFVVAIWLFSLVNDQPVWHLFDLLTPSILLALAVMQLGHFFLQITVGFPLPEDIAYGHTIAEYIEFHYRPSGFENYEYFFPVALYQAAAQIICVVIIVVWNILKRNIIMLNEGCIFLFGIAMCGLIRFVCGFLYLSAKPGLHSGQIISLVVFLVAGILLYLRLHSSQKWYRGGFV